MLQFGGARLPTSWLARTLAPPINQTPPLPESVWCGWCEEDVSLRRFPAIDLPDNGRLFSGCGWRRCHIQGQFFTNPIGAAQLWHGLQQMVVLGEDSLK